MYCTKCGSPIISGAIFCNVCGNKIESEVFSQANLVNTSPAGQVLPNASAAVMATATPIAAGAAKTVSTAVSAKIITAIIISAMIGAGIFLYNMFFVVEPVDIVNKFVQAINEKDVNAAISCMDPTTEKTYTAASSILSGVIGVEITDVMDLLPGLLEMSGSPVDLQMEITDVVSQFISGNDATVVVNIKALATDENGIQTPEGGQSSFRLHKFNDGWRITSFE
ncbi:MAG: hypothetical protein PHU36_05880 [Syntrophomonadaceae bacterium]|nr:hypothetical protein [Syntrophomonadaceae bacterium]